VTIDQRSFNVDCNKYDFEVSFIRFGAGNDRIFEFDEGGLKLNGYSFNLRFSHGFGDVK